MDQTRMTFVLIGLAVMSAYAAPGARSVRFPRRRGAMWVDRTCGAVLLLLSGSLALYRRAGT